MLALSFNDARPEDPDFTINAQGGREWKADDLQLIGLGTPLYFMLPASATLTELNPK